MNAYARTSVRRWACVVFVALAGCVTTEHRLRPHCYQSTQAFDATGQCGCITIDEDELFPSTDWKTDTRCSGGELPPNTVCCAEPGIGNEGQSACACARPSCTIVDGASCECGVLAPQLATTPEDDADNVSVGDCNPGSTMDCCILPGGSLCLCTPGQNTECDAAGGTRVDDCTIANATVQCAESGLSMRVSSCENVTYECASDTDCDKTCSDPACARCLVDGKCLCGNKSGSSCSY